MASDSPTPPTDIGTAPQNISIPWAARCILFVGTALETTNEREEFFCPSWRVVKLQ